MNTQTQTKTGEGNAPRKQDSGSASVEADGASRANGTGDGSRRLKTRSKWLLDIGDRYAACVDEKTTEEELLWNLFEDFIISMRGCSRNVARIYLSHAAQQRDETGKHSAW